MLVVAADQAECSPAFLAQFTYLLPVLGPGSLTPVQDFTRHSVRLMDAHLVSEAPARLEAREPQVSHITLHSSSFFFSSSPISFHLASFQNVPQYSFAQAFTVPKPLHPLRAAGEADSRAEVHIQSHRHPRRARLKVQLQDLRTFLICVSLQCVWNDR